MITTILLYLNVLTGLSITIYTLLHMIFNDNIPYKRRLSLIFPAFSMVCYTIAAFEWAYHVYYGSVFEGRVVLWIIVSWLMIISVFVVAHCNWNTGKVKGQKI